VDRVCVANCEAVSLGKDHVLLTRFSFQPIGLVGRASLLISLGRLLCGHFEALTVSEESAQIELFLLGQKQGRNCIPLLLIHFTGEARPL
jgi:hypothetical protein